MHNGLGEAGSRDAVPGRLTAMFQLHNVQSASARPAVGRHQQRVRAGGFERGQELGAQDRQRGRRGPAPWEIEVHEVGEAESMIRPRGGPARLNRVAEVGLAEQGDFRPNGPRRGQGEGVIGESMGGGKRRHKPRLRRHDGSAGLLGQGVDSLGVKSRMAQFRPRCLLGARCWRRYCGPLAVCAIRK